MADAAPAALLFSYDDMVIQLMRQCGVTRDRAEELACRAGYVPPPKPTVALDAGESTRTHDPARAAVLEDTEQQAGVDHLRSRGWEVWETGISQAGRVCQTPGVPDVIALHPTWGVLFWEAKRPHLGELSKAQQKFAAACRAASVPYCWGALPDLMQYVERRWPNARRAQ